MLSLIVCSMPPTAGRYFRSQKKESESMIFTEDKTIAVIGATGRQGGQVVRHLLNHGWQVRGLTRNPESKKAAALKALGVEVVKADLEDKASLEAAFENAYGVLYHATSC